MTNLQVETSKFEAGLNKQQNKVFCANMTFLYAFRTQVGGWRVVNSKVNRIVKTLLTQSKFWSCLLDLWSTARKKELEMFSELHLKTIFQLYNDPFDDVCLFYDTSAFSYQVKF